MGSYRQPCIRCGALVEPGAQFCPSCGSGSPFCDLCPSCRTPVDRSQRICSGCGRPLVVACPHCGQPTFVQERCDRCGQSLMIRCENRRCGALQFFQNTKCTACGKALKPPKATK